MTVFQMLLCGASFCYLRTPVLLGHQLCWLANAGADKRCCLLADCAGSYAGWRLLTLTSIVACLQTVLEQGGSFAGINRKVQIKPLKWSQPEEGSTEEPRVTEALLILKHGGVLTHAGRQQVGAEGYICGLFRVYLDPRTVAPACLPLVADITPVSQLWGLQMPA